MSTTKTLTAYSVSVVIPAFNAEKYLKRAIDSVLAQTRYADEIILVDDGSSDGTAEVAKQYGEKITYIYQRNAGPGEARNRGIKSATSNLIAFLDADDEWVKDKLAIQIEFMHNNPDMAWVAANSTRCICGTQSKRLQINPDKIKQLFKDNNRFEYLEAFSARIRPDTNSMLIRRKALIDAGLFDTNWRNAEDIDLWLKISYDNPQIGFVNRSLSTYHMGTTGSLATNPISYSLTAEFLERHLEITANNGITDKFMPIAKDMLWAWIRSSFFDDRIYDTRKALEQFPHILSKRQRSFVNCMTIIPGLTKFICRTLSFISRKLKLRKQNCHPTEEYKNQSNTGQ